MGVIRTLVVDDSETVRKMLVDIIGSDPDFEVIGEAENGRRAIELCQQHRPSLILMDMMMPVMTGLSATEYIMAYCPTPILIVSASTNRGELFKIYDALAAGAVDVLEKPMGDAQDIRWDQRLLSVARMAARIRVITHPRARLLRETEVACPPAFPVVQPAQPDGAMSVIAIGASTGGPGAIVRILRSLPAAFDVPILLVVHMNESFATAFADWLAGQSPRTVLRPEDGMPVAAGRGAVFLAPGGQHLCVRDGRVHLTVEEERHSCRPSIDVLFESVAVEYGAAAAACLLTGMGKDGALGLLRIRQAGGVTIAQDEESSVVYGMPREAARLGAAQQILGIESIGPRLIDLRGLAMEARA